MFKSLEVERFRGIKHFRTDELKSINLFFGNNNCGKSTLLDAVFLIAGLSNPKLPVNINLLRNYRKLEKADILLNFYKFDSSLPITIKTSNENLRELRIYAVESSSAEVDLLGSDNNLASISTGSRYGLKLEYRINGDYYESSLILAKKNESEQEQKINLDDRYKETLTCRYLVPKYDFYTSIEGFVSIIKNKDEQFIINALRLIEPKLKDAVLSQNEILIDVGYDKRIPINMMGDGARKLLSILTTIYECKNGIILIDEISNGFHHSVMKGLWQVVISAAKTNNVQVFATTHDIDSIKGLRDAAFPADKADVACFKLQNTAESELVPYHYSVDSLGYSIAQEIEIR